jgi:2-polyprenyl-3-methyl-5-hydroxy-6-metoxy-1,4-benzoquinol methylase
MNPSWKCGAPAADPSTKPGAQIIMMAFQFAIHRTDLSRRRRRCRDDVDRVSRLTHEVVPHCNMCGSERRAVVATSDRYGCGIRTAMCLDCGLLYVIDRLTSEGYDDFYAKGIYRSIIGQFKGSSQTTERVRAAQVYYATTLVTAMQGLLPVRDGATLLDVGGSAGIIARQFADAFGYKPVLFDPAPDEVEAARAMGIDATVATIENFSCDRKYDLILLCRTVEHLFDLRFALRKIRTLLAPGGLFYCDFSDFMEVCRREGPPEATTKIDHCYWLTQETAPALFQSAGFEIVCMNTTMSSEQVGFLLRGAEETQLSSPAAGWAEHQVRKLREIETDWRRDAQTPFDTRDWLRSKSYRIKQMLAG